MKQKKISNEYSIGILRIINSYIISYIAFYETVINNLTIILYYKIKMKYNYTTIIELQKEFAKKVKTYDYLNNVDTVCGIDVSYKEVECFLFCCNS